MIIPEISNILLQELDLKGIRYKDKTDDIIITCPYCLKEGKEKLKMYISKKSGVYHCFRCGKKGHIVNLKLLYELGLYDTASYIQENVDITETIKILKDERNLEVELNDIKTNPDKYLRFIFERAKSQANFLRQCTIPESKFLISKAQSYLIKRNISPHLLKFYGIKYFICTNEQSKLFGRIVIPSYLYTTYEARTFINQSLRYLKHGTDVPDFPTFILKHGKFINPFQLFKEKKSLELETINAVEGVFDGLRISQFGVPSLSISGKVNTLRTMKFLFILRELFKIKINKVNFIFDKDVSNYEIKKFINFYNFELYDLFKIKVETFKMSEYKDFSSVPEEEIEEQIGKVKEVM